MSEPTTPPPTSTPAPTVSPLPPAAPRRSGGFLRALGRLLLIITTVALSLVAGAALLLLLGYTPTLPRELADSRAQLATAQVQRDALQIQQQALQTQVAEQERRLGDQRELTDQIQRDLTGLGATRDQLLADSGRVGTAVAEARTSREAVAAFATAEAGRVVLLEALRRRSDRVERFIQRIGDLAGDASADLAAEPGGTQTVTPTANLTPSAAASSPTTTAVPSPTARPTATVTPTP